MSIVLHHHQLALFPLDKRCTKCGLVKVISEFSRNASGPDGFYTICKRCIARDPGAYDRRRGLVAPVGMKRCTKCGTAKPLTSFSRNSISPDGHEVRCKDCVHAYYRAHRDALMARRRRSYATGAPEREAARAAREREIQARTEKTCRLCGAVKPLTAFCAIAVRGHQRRARHSWCRACLYRRNQMRRYLLTRVQAADLLTAQAGRCFYCQASLDHGFHVDHMVPLARGGSNALDNLCLACARCNLRKNSKTAAAWRDILAREMPDGTDRTGRLASRSRPSTR